MNGLVRIESSTLLPYQYTHTDFHLSPAIAIAIAIELVRAARYVDPEAAEYARSMAEAEAELDALVGRTP